MLLLGLGKFSNSFLFKITVTFNIPAALGLPAAATSSPLRRKPKSSPGPGSQLSSPPLTRPHSRSMLLPPLPFPPPPIRTLPPPPPRVIFPHQASGLASVIGLLSVCPLFRRPAPLGSATSQATEEGIRSTGSTSSHCLDERLTMSPEVRPSPSPS